MRVFFTKFLKNQELLEKTMYKERTSFEAQDYWCLFVIYKRHQHKHSNNTIERNNESHRPHCRIEVFTVKDDFYPNSTMNRTLFPVYE
jgi:IS1 family transposase